MDQDTETTEATAQGSAEATEQHSAAEEGDDAASAEADERDALQAELAEARSVLEKELAIRGQLEADLAAAVESCRKALLASAPELPAEMVQGSTVAELEASFGHAKALAERVRRQVEAQAAQERVPAGAPPRRGVDPSALSAHRRCPRSRRSCWDCANYSRSNGPRPGNANG